MVSMVQVRTIEQTMKEWSQNVDKLFLEHKWLLIFNIPKLLKLSKLLRSAFQPDSDAEEIMEEIGFLFCNDVQAREKVTVAIKVTINVMSLDLELFTVISIFLQGSLSTLRSELLSLEQMNEASIPLRVCGLFLDALFKRSERVDYSPQKYNEHHRTYSALICQPISHTFDSMEVLHYAPDFTQGELISIIVDIYHGRLPQPYELFRCHENSTAHQLKLFLTRALNHPLTFVILGVNLLPINLQEVHILYISLFFRASNSSFTLLQMLLKQHMDFHSSSDGHEKQPCIHYVETLPSVLQEMPWIQHEKHKVFIHET